jgi:hypothetical protein
LVVPHDGLVGILAAKGVREMPGSLRYVDAARLLGGNGPALEALDRVLGGALTTAAGPAPDLVLSLLGADAQIAQLSRSLVSSTAERIRGLGRFERTELVAAAHAVIVVAAYGDAMTQTDLPFSIRELELTRTDSVRLATGEAPASRRLSEVADHLLRSHLPLPSPLEPYEATLSALREFYAAMSERVEEYLRGLAVWDRLTSAQHQDVRESFREHVPRAAMSFYEAMFRQLAVDFPDVAVWANGIDHQATRVAVCRLEETITRLAHGQLPPGRLAALRRAGARQIDAPVLGAEDTAEGMMIPTLREAYVSADFRVAAFGPADRLTAEAWWQEHEVRGGLDGFLEGFLTAPAAIQAPILLLGLPGSGKSLLTKVLTARLPAEDFLPVRVPLRDVPAESEVQDQIEAAIRQATGEKTMGWADVARAAGNALPVVLLDGFDELLQATGVHQSDYLERVATFQQREAALGRPLAIIVTSRTVVADRARLSPGGIAILLEPFNPDQIGQWLELWNRKNAAYYDRHGLNPLAPEQALTQPDLANQPLLLLMLALYDAQDNAFQREAGTLASFELYERLLEQFARREVLKHHMRLPDEDLVQAVEYELLRLSVAAFAMFNRGRQWVSEDELEMDLAALLPQRPSPTTTLRAALSGAQTTVGRFFFIHRAEAFRDEVRLRSYEFLHATFGEFLVARLVTHELLDLMAAERAEARRARPSNADDSYLHALLSFAACAGRAPVVSFLVEALRPLPAQDREQLRRLLLRLFQEVREERPVSAYRAYQPSRRPGPAAPALYCANLLLLLLVVADEVSGRELFPSEEDPVGAWRDTMLLLESQLYVEEWRALAGRLGLERMWHGEGRNVKLRLENGLLSQQWQGRSTDRTADIRAVNPYWSYGYAPGSVARQRYAGFLLTYPDELAWGAHLRCDTHTDVLLHSAQSLEELGLGQALTSFVILEDGEAVSAARLLIRLWNTAGDFSAVHRDALWAALYSFAPNAREFADRYLTAVLRQWELAGHPVPQDWLARAQELDWPEADGARSAVFAELPNPPV